MTWGEVDRVIGGGPGVPVSVSICKASKRCQPTMEISISHQVAERAGFKIDDRVRVFYGEGSDLGSVRLYTDESGPFRLANKSSTRRRMYVRLPRPRSLFDIRAFRSRTAPVVKAVPGELIIDLPADINPRTSPRRPVRDVTAPLMGDPTPADRKKRMAR